MEQLFPTSNTEMQARDKIVRVTSEALRGKNLKASKQNCSRTKIITSLCKLHTDADQLYFSYRLRSAGFGHFPCTPALYKMMASLVQQYISVTSKKGVPPFFLFFLPPSPLSPSFCSSLDRQSEKKKNTHTPHILSPPSSPSQIPFDLHENNNPYIKTLTQPLL